MNVVFLKGVLSSAPVTRQLASGSVVVSLEVSTTIDGAVASVPVAWFDPPTAVSWDAGTEVVVDGVVRRRFFRSAGLTQSRTEVVAAEVVAADDRRGSRRLVRRAVRRLGGDDAGGVRSG